MNTAGPPRTTDSKTITEPLVRQALREVIDPELNCNILDLGLVYGIDIDQNKVRVQMTLTTAGCPMHQSLIHGVQAVLLSLPTVEEVEVELVWDPPWNPHRMSPQARQQLGIALDNLDSLF